MMRSKIIVESKARKREKARKESRPAPLPRTRPSSLTPPLEGSTTTSPARRPWNPLSQSPKQNRRQRRTSDQTQSGLLSRLPAELRIRIWRHVLGGQLLHMACLHKKLCAVACPVMDCLQTGLEVHESKCWLLSPVYVPYALTPHLHEKHQLPHRAGPAHLIPLLQTCRLVYSEAVDIMYSQNTFDFTDPDSLLYFAESILPERLARVRRINITWMDLLNYRPEDVPWDADTWPRLCAALRKCAGLVQLTVRLGVLRHATDGQTRALLDALAQCEVAGQFDVIMEWPQARCRRFAAERSYPFRLMSVLDYDVTRLDYTEQSIAFVNHPGHS